MAVSQLNKKPGRHSGLGKDNRKMGNKERKENWLCKLISRCINLRWLASALAVQCRNEKRVTPWSSHVILNECTHMYVSCTSQFYAELLHNGLFLILSLLFKKYATALHHSWRYKEQEEMVLFQFNSHATRFHGIFPLPRGSFTAMGTNFLSLQM
jgi:hypothetical protein